MSLEPTLDELVARLSDDDPVVRATTVDALAVHRDPSTIEALMWLLGDDSLWVRCNAAEALGEIRQPEVVEPLVAFLKLGVKTEVEVSGMPDREPLRFHRFSRQHDPVYTAWLRAQEVSVTDMGLNLAVSARLALQKTGILATDVLIDLLDDENPYMRYIAGNLLNAMCMRRKPMKALIHALDSDVLVRRQRAALALGRLGNFGAIDALVGVLDDPDPMVRLAAVESLGVIKDERAVIPLTRLGESDEAMRSAVWAALANIRAGTQPEKSE
jgi:HEAT repeat protein